MTSLTSRHKGWNGTITIIAPTSKHLNDGRDMMHYLLLKQ